MFLIIKEKYFISFRFVSSFSMFVIKRKMFHVISQFCEFLSTFVIKRKMFHIVHTRLLLRERVRMDLSTSVLPSRI